VTFDPIHLDRNSVWPRLDAAKMVFAAALKNVLPRITSLESEVDGFCFRGRFLFKGPLPPLFLTLMIEEMRRIKKEQLPLQRVEMIRSNAAAFLKHHRMVEKGEALEEKEDEVASFIKLQDDIEETFAETTLETTFDMGVVQLLVVQEKEDGLYEVIGTAFEDDKEAKNFAKIFKDRKPELSDWVEGVTFAQKRDALFSSCRKKWDELGFKELIPFFAADMEEVEQEAFSQGKCTFFLPNHDVGFVFGSDKDFPYWKGAIDGWLKQFASAPFERIESKWGVQWLFITPIGSRLPGPFMEMGRKAKFSSPKKEVVCHPIHISLIGQLKSWLTV